MSTADAFYIAALEILLAKSMRGQVASTHVDIVFERVYGRKPSSRREIANTVMAALEDRLAAMVIAEGLVVWRQS